MISRIVRKLIRTALPNHWISHFGITSSQNGEDVMIRGLFAGQRYGFFVDVGAHHPFRFSNTYLLYRAGWSGLNIDALPGTKRLFDRYRPRDITIEAGVATAEGVLEYWSF